MEVRTAATSKVEELFGIVVNDWKPLTIIPKSSTLVVAAILDPPLEVMIEVMFYSFKLF